MDKLASIEIIEQLENITGFDRLQLATVAGYKTVVPKNKYSVGEYVIYVAIDSVLPGKPEYEEFKKYSKKRVKTARIGNKGIGYVWSQGLVLDLYTYLPDLPKVEQQWLDKYDDLKGIDVSSLLGITKYEEPVPQELNAAGKLPFRLVKTDEDRYQSVPSHKYLNQVGNVTLKVDGTSFTAAYNLATDEFKICGRTLEYKLDCKHKYSDIANKYDLANKLKSYCVKHGVSLAISGEIYGQGIQNCKNNWHSKQALDVAFYSTWNIDKGQYERITDEHYIFHVCNELELPTVPLLRSSQIITLDLIEYYETLESAIFSHSNQIVSTPFEGVVITTDNLSFKVINKHYDMSK